MHPHNGANNISIIDYLFKNGAILDLSSYPFDNIEGDGQGNIKNYNIADLANMFYDAHDSIFDFKSIWLWNGEDEDYRSYNIEERTVY